MALSHKGPASFSKFTNIMIKICTQGLKETVVNFTEGFGSMGK